MPLGPGDVGRRVVVRYLLPEPEPGASATDVVGLLVTLDGSGLEILTEAGTVVRVPADRVVAGKPVPGRPTRRGRLRREAGGQPRIDADTLQRVCDQGWPARTVRRLGDWRLREAAGFTGRANSALALGDPGMPLDEALSAVQAFYDDLALPPLVQAVTGAPVERLVLDAGWEVARHPEGVLVQTAPVAEARRANRHVPGADVALHDEPTPGWMSVYGRTAGVPAEAVAGVLAGPETTAFAAVAGAGPGDGPVAIGRAVVTGDWLGLAAVEVVAARRREGLAGRVVDTLLEWGADHGARSAYLQTLPDNAAALALYRPYGFVTHHRYRYLGPGPDVRALRGVGRSPAR